MKRIFLVIVFLIIVLLIFLYIIFNKNIQGLFSDSNQIRSKSINSQNHQNKIKTNNVRFSAWIPYWDYTNGLKTLEKNSSVFSEILPVIYEVEKDGSLKIKNSNFDKLQKFANDNSIKFIPSIAMFDHELFSEVLNNDENFQKHIDTIISEIEENNFDGIDIDYESTKLDDKDKYEKFIINLAQKINELEKSTNKKITLSITVLPKWGPDIIYPSLNETRAVQDWKFLNQYADQIRIMAYDYTSQYSEKPGPIAPTNWMEIILQKAMSEIDKDKLIIALPTYGYNWASSDIDESVNFFNNPPTQELKADAYTYDQIIDIKKEFGGNEYIHPKWDEIVYKYNRGDDKERVLIYQNTKSIKRKVDVIKEGGIYQISFWRLGGDLYLNYSELKNLN